jgi:hypothetical protein
MAMVEVSGQFCSGTGAGWFEKTEFWGGVEDQTKDYTKTNARISFSINRLSEKCSSLMSRGRVTSCPLATTNNPS